MADRERAGRACAAAADGNGGGADGTVFARGRAALHAAAWRRSTAGAWSCATSTPASATSRPLREGREVYLCWRVGEERIEWWHETDAGFAGRRPLDDAIP